MRMRARLFQARASQGGSAEIAAMGSLSRFCGARLRAQVEPLLWSSYVLMAVGMQAAARPRAHAPARVKPGQRIGPSPARVRHRPESGPIRPESTTTPSQPPVRVKSESLVKHVRVTYQAPFRVMHWPESRPSPGQDFPSQALLK